MPTEQYRDILDVVDGIICHQVNPFVMGAGLALAIRRRFPKVYKEFVHRKETDPLDLGDVLFVQVSPTLWVANMCAQHTFGRNTRRVYTDYPAFQSCLAAIDYEALKKEKKVYFPYKIGCGLAKGNWNTVYHLIGQRIPYAIICRLGRK
jgi:hypothetical protein